MANIHRDQLECMQMILSASPTEALRQTTKVQRSLRMVIWAKGHPCWIARGRVRDLRI
jgi:ribosomal protein L31